MNRTQFDRATVPGLNRFGAAGGANPLNRTASALQHRIARALPVHDETEDALRRRFESLGASISEHTRCALRVLRTAEQARTMRERAVALAENRESLALCLECRLDPISTANGRYCNACVDAALWIEDHPGAEDVDFGPEVRSFLRRRVASQAAWQQAIHKGESLIPREFERDDIDCRATALELGSARRAKASQLANSFAWRFPDQAGGIIWLGRSDLALIPCFSPETSRWVVLKCAKRGGGKSGEGFSWDATDFLYVSSGTVTRWNAPAYWGTTDRPTGSRPERFEDWMNEAWAVGEEWKRQLETTWELNGMDSQRYVPGMHADAADEDRKQQLRLPRHANRFPPRRDW